MGKPRELGTGMAVLGMQHESDQYPPPQKKVAKRTDKGFQPPADGGLLGFMRGREVQYSPAAEGLTLSYLESGAQ